MNCLLRWLKASPKTWMCSEPTAPNITKNFPSEFHTLVCLPLYTNGLFQLRHELWDQVTGVAIGGPLSAQNASAVCMEAESNVPLGSVLRSHIK